MAEEGSLKTEMNPQSNTNKIGPDLFGFYKHEIIHLLTLNLDFPLSYSTFSNKSTIINNNNNNNNNNSLFNNSLDDSVPLFKIDLLRSSLRQSVTALTQEVDELIDPIMRTRHILSCLNSKTNKSLNGEALATRDLDSTSPPCKMQKMCKEYLSAERNKDDETETAEDDEDLKLLLGSKSTVVEQIMAKQSNEHYEMLNHMELQLEELLAAVVSKCRPMTRQEKHQLGKFIQELAPKNLDRVVEIIHFGKSYDTLTLDEIVVDLEELDNATLWRLYFYTRAVENAKKLSA